MPMPIVLPTWLPSLLPSLLPKVKRKFPATLQADASVTARLAGGLVRSDPSLQPAIYL